MIHLITTKKTTQTEKITVLDDITKVINILSNETELCLDTETSGLNPLKDIVKMLQIGTLKGDQYIIDTRDFNLDLLKPLLENPKILYIGHNIKFDYNMLKQYDIVLNNVYDTMIVDQVIYNGRYSIKEISESKRFSLFGVYKHYFNKEIKKDTRNEFIYIGNKDYTEDQIIYGAMDVVYPIEIKNKQEELIELYNLKNVINLENRFTLVLGDMEYNGFKIDINKLKTVIKETIKNREISIKELDEYLISKAPNYRKQGTQLSLFGDHDTRLTHVNWSSDQQVYDILTKVFNINAVDKYGKNSAGKDALEQLDEEYYDPIISKLLKYRQQEKIITSFGEEYIHKYIDKDNRIHTSFNQIVSTGRISSRNPKKLGVYIVIYILNRLNCWKTEMLISSQDSEC
ncbi:MAG: DNA polymerase [Methanogenium sp.]|jgi:DNA polymerase I-like protein with 3'-5' exonuclease and polymerase domains